MPQMLLRRSDTARLSCRHVPTSPAANNLQPTTVHALRGGLTACLWICRGDRVLRAATRVAAAAVSGDHDRSCHNAAAALPPRRLHHRLQEKRNGIVEP